jgi:hypothetical protein
MSNTVSIICIIPLYTLGMGRISLVACDVRYSMRIYEK